MSKSVLGLTVVSKYDNSINDDSSESNNKLKTKKVLTLMLDVPKMSLHTVSHIQWPSE